MAKNYKPPFEDTSSHRPAIERIMRDENIKAELENHKRERNKRLRDIDLPGSKRGRVL